MSILEFITCVLTFILCKLLVLYHDNVARRFGPIHLNIKQVVLYSYILSTRLKRKNIRLKFYHFTAYNALKNSDKTEHSKIQVLSWFLETGTHFIKFARLCCKYHKKLIITASSN